MPDEALNTTYKIEGDTVKSTYQGQSYTAELDGPAVPVQKIRAARRSR